jgi:hypothetical protein
MCARQFRVKMEAKAVGVLEVQQYLFSRQAGFLHQLGRQVGCRRPPLSSRPQSRSIIIIIITTTILSPS